MNYDWKLSLIKSAKAGLITGLATGGVTLSQGGDGIVANLIATGIAMGVEFIRNWLKNKHKRPSKKQAK